MLTHAFDAAVDTLTGHHRADAFGSASEWVHGLSLIRRMTTEEFVWYTACANLISEKGATMSAVSASAIHFRWSHRVPGMETSMSASNWIAQSNAQNTAVFVALLVVVALGTATTNAQAHCQAAFVGEGPVMRRGPVGTERIGFGSAQKQAAAVRPGFAVPSSAELLTFKEYADLAHAQAADNQPSLVYAAMLVAAYLKEGKFNEVTDLLDRLKIQPPKEWAFDATDGASRQDIADVRPSTEAVTAYLIGARAYARMQTADLSTPSLWAMLTDYQTSRQFLNRLFWSLRGFRLPEVPEKVQGRLLQEIERLDTMPGWERRAAIEMIPQLLGYAKTEGGSRIVYARGSGAMFGVVAEGGGSGGGIGLISDRGCHHFYLEGFRFAAASHRAFRGTFELASVVLSDGKLIMMISEDLRDQLGLTNDHFTVTEVDVQRLRSRAATPLASTELRKVVEHLRRTNKALVFWQHPLAQKAGEQAAVVHQFVSDLHRMYPGIGIYRDPPEVDLGPRVQNAQLARLNTLPARVVFDTAYGVKLTEDANAVANHYAKMGRGIEVLPFGPSTSRPAHWASEPALVIVITGSTGPQLAKLVRDLGEKGFLKDNFILFEACGEALSEALVSEMTGRFGARAAYHFAGPIHPADAALLLDEVLAQKNKGGNAKLEAVPARATNSIEKKLKKPMVGAWTVSRASIDAQNGEVS
jgi:hypothetical protein